MELNIAVVDDNAASISEVISMMRRFMHEVENITINISKFGSGEKFFKDFSQNAFHAVFLDICMDDMNGIELSRHLRSVDKNIAIIFMSTTTEFVFQTFQATPFGYLVKPFSFEQFAEIMNKTVKFFSENNKNISIRISRMEITLELENICSVTANGHNTEIKTVSGNIIKSVDTYKYFQSHLLCEDYFLECNRGILVNMNCIVNVQENNIIMKDGAIFPIKLRSKKDVMTKLTKYLSKTLKGEMFT